MEVKQNKYTLGESIIAEITEGIKEFKLDLKLTTNNKKINIASSISGVVLDETNNPIKNAVIKLIDLNFEPLTHVFTDDKGGYIIDGILQSKSYNLIVTSQGKLPVKSESFSLNNGEKKILNFTLINDTSNTLGAISGVIKDSNTFISGAVISLYSIVNNERLVMAITYTDKKGEFLLSKIPSGNYNITISALAYISQDISIEVKGGQIINKNVLLSYDENISKAIISGIITDDNNTGITNASVVLYNVDLEKKVIAPIAFSTTNANGVYTFINVPKGNYMVKSNKWQLIDENSTVPFAATGNETSLMNIALNKVATASSSEVNYGRGPEMALDGQLNTRWCALTNSPNEWWQVDLANNYNLSRIEIYWEQNASYGFIIQVSMDGVNWKNAFDNTSNISKQNISTITLNENSVRYVKLQMKSLPSIDIYASFYEFKVFGSISNNISLSKLEGFFANNNKHYLREDYKNIITESTIKTLNLVCWKGEKISTEIILWTDTLGANGLEIKPSLLVDKYGNKIEATNIQFNFLRYVKAADKMIPDILDNSNTLNIPSNNIQPVWLTINIPENTIAGTYSGNIIIYSDNSNTLNFKINIEVLNIVLPSYDKWTFHLDLWQNPYALARYYKVTPWSREHIDYLRPHLKMLRKAGQKVITTTIIKDPWNSQTYDAYDTMISWKKQVNGIFKYDFTAFDLYVSLCLEIGIDKQINCYSMVPWNNRIIYFDEIQGKEVQEFLTPGSSKWTDYWQQFINALVEHVKSKGWQNKTYIAMDERPINDMKAVVNLLKNTPLKISGAMNYADVTDIVNSINDISMAIWELPSNFYDIVESRHKLSFNTTYYVCTGAFPNTFTYSNPGEAAWMGWYTAKFNADGFLRWAYDSWVEKPLETTDFIRFESGDCFLVYPDARSSVRFERLIEGFQDNEKIRYITKNNANWTFEINKILLTLQGGSNIRSVDYGYEVMKARSQLNNIARRIANGEIAPIYTNIALNKVTTASSSETSYGRGPEKGVDGQLNTRWCAATGSPNEWWQVDLANNYNLTGIEIYWEQNDAYGFVIQASADGVNWRIIFDNTSKIIKENISTITVNENSVRYVKLQMKSLPSIEVYASFYEFRVFGTKVS